MIKQLLVCWMGVLRWRGDAARSSYDESVIIRAMQQTQCMGSREIDSNHYGSINSSQTLLLSLNSILGFCSALELVDVVFSDYHRRANLLMYNNNNWRVV